MRYQAQEAPFNPSINFWNIPHGFKDVWTTKQWKSYILEHGSWTFAQGYIWDWRSKAIGGGLRNVWLEKRP